MQKSATTIISSCTIKSGETTALADCTTIDLSRGTQLILTVKATYNSAATSGLAVYLYTSTDDSVYTDKWWDDWTVQNCRQVGFTSGNYEWMPNETVAAAAGGEGTVSGWTLDSGTWAGGDAAGDLYLENISGTFTTTQALTGGTSSCSAIQNGDITAHAITRTYYASCVSPLYIRCRIHNLDTGYDITSASLISVKQTL